MVRVDRLGLEVIHSGLEATPAILDHGAGGHGNHTLACQRWRCPDLARGLVAVHYGHLHVHQHDIEAFFGQLLQRLAPVAAKRHHHPALQEQFFDHLLVERIVLGHQDARAPQERTRAGQLHFRGLRHRNSLTGLAAPETRREAKAAACPSLALDPDSPAHQFDQSLGDHEPQARAAEFARGRSVDLGEGREQPFDLARGETDAAVAHPEFKLD